MLCDLGTDPSRFPDFRDRIGALTKRLSVTYIDHHYLSDEMKTELVQLGIRMVHDVNECSSMLTYKTFEALLPTASKYLALYGAVTDYIDSSPLAGKMMERFDRQFVLLESTLLSYSISNHGRNPEYLEGLVRALSRMEVPHTIRGVSESALKQARRSAELEGEVGSKGRVLGEAGVHGDRPVQHRERRQAPARRVQRAGRGILQGEARGQGRDEPALHVRVQGPPGSDDKRNRGEARRERRRTREGCGLHRARRRGARGAQRARSTALAHTVQ